VRKKLGKKKGGESSERVALGWMRGPMSGRFGQGERPLGHQSFSKKVSLLATRATGLRQKVSSIKENLGYSGKAAEKGIQRVRKALLSQKDPSR